MCILYCTSLNNRVSFFTITTDLCYKLSTNIYYRKPKPSYQVAFIVLSKQKSEYVHSLRSEF